jgi:plasmid stabilization system protein ParE
VSYRLEIRPDALSDIAEASTWYEEREPRLGGEFVRAMREAIGNLPGNPLAHRLRYRRQNVRWFLPSRFPYRVIYRVQGDLITIIAVLHAARHDRHWKERT